MNVTTDSEDDSNKGDSLNNTFKTMEDSTGENKASPLNIMSDSEEDDAGRQMLSHFPPSECPVIVDITTNDSIGVGNSSKQSPKAEDEACNDKGTSAVSTKDDMVSTRNSDQSDENVFLTDAMNSNSTITNLMEESCDTKIVDDLESQPVERTGSFPLISNNGVLKVADTGQTPVSTGNGNEVMSPDRNAEQSHSDEARKKLGETISETLDLDKEFRNVYKYIEKLEMMSENNVESSNEFTNETSKDDSGQNGEDSKTMVIAVDGTVSTEQTTHCKIKCVVTNESTMDDCVDGRNDKEVNESEEGIDTPSPVLAKRRPRKLRNPKGYSFETESGLLSPEDDVHVELKKIQNSGSFKRDGSSVLASESEADGMSPDGQQHDEVTPSPPPRVIAAQSKNLRYSLSFNTAGKLDFKI